MNVLLVEWTVDVEDEAHGLYNSQMRVPQFILRGPMSIEMLPVV